MTDEPLIFTTKGNLPEASLVLEVKWFFYADRVELHEDYKLGDEIVRQNVHKYSYKGLPCEVMLGQIN